MINASVVNEKIVLNYEIKEFSEKNKTAFDATANLIKDFSKSAYNFYVKNGVALKLIFSKEGQVIKVLDIESD